MNVRPNRGVCTLLREGEKRETEGEEGFSECASINALARDSASVQSIYLYSGAEPSKDEALVDTGKDARTCLKEK
jgi:hypothetical protein